MEGGDMESFRLEGSVQGESVVGFMDGTVSFKPTESQGSRPGGMPRLRTSLVIGKGMTTGMLATAAKRSDEAEAIDLIRAIRSTSSRMNNAISKQPVVPRPARKPREPLAGAQRTRKPSEEQRHSPVPL